MNIWTLLKISSHSDPRSLNCSSWFRFSLKSIFHLSMVGDGLDAVVHGALLVVHAGDDGMAGVCNRDDPFLHLPTLLVIGNQMTMVMINDDNDNVNDNDNDLPLGERREADYHLQPKLHQCIVSET